MDDVAGASAVRGTVRLGPDRARLQRRVVLLLTVAPLAGFVAAIVSLWGWGISAVDLGILVVTYVLFALGITVGFHRLFTHRSFDAVRPVRITLAILGSMAIQGNIIGWVADHRRHHAYADKDGDPHSPHLMEGEGVGGVLKNLWHAHVGWMFADEKTDVQRWAPDLLKDPAMRTIDRASPLLMTLSLVLPAVVGLAITRSWAGAVTAFLWGGLARAFLLHHVTWSVNSICHFYGPRPYETTDHSTNNWPVALLSLGEGWHNNHHAFPTSAIHGLGRFQPDVTGAVIAALERLGLASNVKRPTPKQLATKKA